MPNCFQLTRKGETEPESLNSIDARLWREIGGEEPDPKKWFCQWYNIIGFQVAMGSSLDECVLEARKRATEKIEKSPDMDPLEKQVWWELVRVAEYLRDNYTSNAFYAPKSALKDY